MSLHIHSFHLTVSRWWMPCKCLWFAVINERMWRSYWYGSPRIFGSGCNGEIISACTDFLANSSDSIQGLNLGILNEKQNLCGLFSPGFWCAMTCVIKCRNEIEPVFLKKERSAVLALLVSFRIGILIGYLPGQVRHYNSRKVMAKSHISKR